MWKVEQILANARYEKKCDYSIYAIYIDYLKNSDVAGDSKAYEQAKKQSKSARQDRILKSRLSVMSIARKKKQWAKFY